VKFKQREPINYGYFLKSEITNMGNEHTNEKFSDWRFLLYPEVKASASMPGTSRNISMPKENSKSIFQRGISVGDNKNFFVT